MALISFDRIEKLARFLAAHLARQALVIRPRAIVGVLRSTTAGLRRRLAGTLWRLIVL
jgi:hypothetical protein